LDHDLTFTPTDATDNWPFSVPDDDPYIEYYPVGERFMNFSRSRYVTNPVDGMRDQFNGITSYIDGSSVYGSTPKLTQAVRLGDNICELNTTASPNGPMLPRNYLDVGFDNPSRKVPETYLFAAGDVRANENPGLTTLHTIFVREHNRQCARIRAANPSMPGEVQFEEARKWVIALLQHVTFNEYIPATIGESLSPYAGYKADVDATVDLLFATALFRYGHSEVLEHIPRTDEEGNTIPQGALRLKECYFNPPCWQSEGPEPILNGMTRTRQMEVDAYYVDAIRNFLFHQPSKKGVNSVDLGARNIQRGRDHGIPSYNKAREYFQLPAALAFSDITSNATLAQLLSDVYGGDVNKVDAYVGALAEDHKTYPYIGDLMGTAIKYQYTCSRDGDRFYFENTAVSKFTEQDINEILSTKLSDIVLRNTNIQKIPCKMMHTGGELCGPGVISSPSASPVNSLSLMEGRYNVSWTISPAFGKTAIDGDAVAAFTIVAETDSWAGFGFNTVGDQMIFSDVYAGWAFENGTFQVNDYKIGKNKDPTCEQGGVCPDTKQGCTNDILTSSASYFPPLGSAKIGTMTVSFSRKLATGDKCDFPITPGGTFVVAAMGRPGALLGRLTAHGDANHASARVVFYDGPTPPSSPVPTTSPATPPPSPVTAVPISQAPAPRVVVYQGSVSLFPGHQVDWTIYSTRSSISRADYALLDPQAEISVTVTAKSDSWAGFGWNGALPRMLGSDVYVGIVDANGNVAVGDYKIGVDKDLGCPSDGNGIDGVCLDTKRGGSCRDDILSYSGTYTPAVNGEPTGTIQYTFNRLLVTGDLQCDYPVQVGMMNVVAAMGKIGAPKGVISGHGKPNKMATTLALLGSVTPAVPSAPTAPSPVLPVGCNAPTPGEFDHFLEALSGRFQFAWTMQPVENHLSLAIAAKTTGWVGLGIADSNGGMVGAESIIGWRGSINSYKLDGKRLANIIIDPVIQLTDVCSAQYIGSDGAQWTVVRAKRSVTAGNNPIALTAGSNTPVVIAYGPNGADYLISHTGNAKAQLLIDFVTGTSKSRSVDPRKVAHGVLMFISWGVVLQFGAFFARYAKPLPNAIWFKVHRIIQFGGFAISIAGFILAIVMTSGRHFHTSSGHAQIGLTVMILGCIQIVVAIFRPNPASVGQNKSIIRVLWEFSHWWFGRLALVLAVATIFLGFKSLHAPIGFTIAWAVIVGISCAAIAGLELYRKFAIDRPHQAYEFVKLSASDPTN